MLRTDIMELAGAKIYAASSGLMSAVLATDALSSPTIDAFKIVIATLVGTASITATVMLVVDNRIEKKVGESHKILLSEIHHLKELLRENGAIK